MSEKEKYYGEVWFPENETARFFCVLSFKDSSVLLETNLVEEIPRHKYLKIIGVFTKLGYLTFLDCEVLLHSSGMIYYAIYKPKYTFTFDDHCIDPLKLKVKKFCVSNNAIKNWRRPKVNFDRVNKSVKLDQEERHLLHVEKIKLSIEIIFNNSYQVSGNGFTLKNNSYIKFEPESPINIAGAFDMYDRTQKLIQFISGNTEQFSSFEIQCSESGGWGTVFFQELSYKDTRSIYFTTNFQEIIPYLPNLFHHIFCNESFHFCIEKLLDNQIKGQ